MSMKRVLLGLAVATALGVISINPIDIDIDFGGKRRSVPIEDFKKGGELHLPIDHDDLFDL
ncbi:MAG: hypothetical protein AAF533_23485 [Acidobacteriota bacterium]